jgi:hypothetical protein
MNHEVKLCQLGAPRNSIYPLHSLGILSTSFTKSELPASSHCSWVDAHRGRRFSFGLYARSPFREAAQRFLLQCGLATNSFCGGTLVKNFLQRG